MISLSNAVVMYKYSFVYFCVEASKQGVIVVRSLCVLVRINYMHIWHL